MKNPICMEPIIRNDVAYGSEWLHQIKWDGIRGLTFIDNNSISIITRNRTNITSAFTELGNLPKQVKANKVLLDGEIVVLDNNGKPSFSHVLKRMNTKNLNKIDLVRNKYPATYILFDILSINEEDVKLFELTKRQEILSDIFTTNDIIRIAKSFSNGKELFKKMKENNMEGIVSKRITSSYTFGKHHRDWYKTKLARKMLCFIMGINYKHGNPSSLSIGIFKGSEIINVGSVYSGLTQNDLSMLDKHYSGNTIINDYMAIKPQLTCWVKFTEWKSSGRLRNPVILGFSNEDIQNANGKEIIL
jgi:bifunctional non-homologous end joining protein LigD